MFCSRESLFDAIRDAAFSLKEEGRWDIVLDRCCRFFRLAEATGLVKKEDAVNPTDKQPFDWLRHFSPNLTPEQWKEADRICWSIFSDFRCVLMTGEDAMAKKKKTPVKKRAREVTTAFAAPAPTPRKIFKLKVVGPTQQQQQQQQLKIN